MFGGVDISGEIPSICPSLPTHWKGIKYNFSFRGTEYFVSIIDDVVELFVEDAENKKIKLHIYGELFEIENREKLTVKYRKEFIC
ncbi:MAG: glycosyl hydrolase family 65 protein [Bacteroidales bacterium]|nr:glycosyl hydrolase family 65 protein [Bacteroidales bacterium]